jgi:hypothetical protein
MEQSQGYPPLLEPPMDPSRGEIRCSTARLFQTDSKERKWKPCGLLVVEREKGNLSGRMGKREELVVERERENRS